MRIDLKKIGFVAMYILISFSVVVAANSAPFLTIYNPFTSKLDYYTLNASGNISLESLNVSENVVVTGNLITTGNITADYYKGKIDYKLVGWWALDESSGARANDSSPYDNHGTLYNFSDDWTTGKFGNALEFNATNETFVDCGNDSSLNMGADDFSVEFWIKTTFATSSDLISKVTVDDYPGWTFTFMSNGKLDFWLTSEAIYAVDVITTVAVNDGAWHHIIGVRDGSIFRVYIDGDLDVEETDATIGDVTGGNNLYIGYYGAIPDYFNGTIDNVRIYNKALSMSEVAEHYRELSLSQGGTVGGDIIMTGNLNTTGNITANYGFFDMRVGIGQTSGFDPRTGLSVTGDVDIIHTATEADDHAFEIDLNAAGFGDVKAIDLVYDTGTMSLGLDEAIILINIDESQATGGDVFGIEILATEGSANIYGMKAGALVGPIHQASGVFANMDTANNSGTDRLAEFISSASDVNIFVNDNDYIIIGDAAKFEELEFLLDTSSSNPGIKPTFGFSTGVGTWDSFTPVDGTNGMRNTGLIAWEDDDIPTWATGTGGEYLINITRTQNNLQTVPIEDKVQIAAVVEYVWNEFGDLSVNTINITNMTVEDMSASIKIGNGTDFGGMCWNGTGIIITGNFSKYCG